MAWTEEGRGLTGTDGDWDARPLLSIRHIGGTPRPNTRNFPTTVRTAYAMGAQCSPSASIVVARCRRLTIHVGQVHAVWHGSQQKQG